MIFIYTPATILYLQVPGQGALLPPNKLELGSYPFSSGVPVVISQLILWKIIQGFWINKETQWKIK